MTKIEWTDESWNPVVGCSKVSAGCKYCYAERMARRQVAMGCARGDNGTGHMETWAAYSTAIDPITGKWSGDIGYRYCALDAPLHWKKPRRVFVVSMGDLFHRDVPFEFIDKVVAVFEKCPQHTGQILTKRGKRLLEYARYRNYVWPDNVIGMVSCENQPAADLRIPLLLQCGFRTKGVSLEPLLGKIDFKKISIKKWWHPPMTEEQAFRNEHFKYRTLNWCIIGCETQSPAHCREGYNENAINLVEQCKAAGVPVFVKSAVLPNGRVTKNIDEFPKSLKFQEYPALKDK